MPREPDLDLLKRPAALRWWLATRPPFLLLAVVPVLIGLASAARDVPIDGPGAIFTLLGAVLFHAAVNVDNDYHDAISGADAGNEGRLFPFTGGSRMIQNGVLDPAQTRRLAASLYAATAVIGLLLAVRTGWPLLALGLAGAALGWAYSAPPFSLAARGAGELTVGLGFGLMIPAGADLVQRGAFDPAPLWAGAGFAAMTMAILVINEFPDRKADRRAGKLNLVVRLGIRRGRWLYPLALCLAALLPALAVSLGELPATALLPLPALLLALPALAGLWRHAHRPRRLAPAIGATIAATLIYGALTAAGLVLA